MTIHLGTVPANSTLYIPFATYDVTNGASVTMSNFAVTDIEIYKNGSTTQRASDNGYTLLDTDGTDFDGITGLHGFSVSLADNSDSGFYSVGGFYWVVVSTVTVSAQTVTVLAATFRIGPAESVTGYQPVDTVYVEGADATTTINGEMVDALSVDAYAEPGSGAPASSASLSDKIGYLYKAWRNKITQTSSTYSLYGDDTTTVHHTATLSDDGTTFTKTEIS